MNANRLQTHANRRVTHDNCRLSPVTPPETQPPQTKNADLHLVELPRQYRFDFAYELIDDSALEKRLAEIEGPGFAQPRAENTRRSYAADWKPFQAFCRDRDIQALPASPETVKRFLLHQESLGRAAATITRRVAAITARHRQEDLETPCDRKVRRVLSAIRRNLGTAPKPKIPVSSDLLKALIEATDEDVRGLRDRAILALAFFTGCRRSEVAGLNLADATSDPQGLAIWIGRSKTDQDGKGREIGVHFGANAFCPVRLVDAWKLERGPWAGPLFCRVGQHSGAILRDRLSPAAIAAVLKSALKRIGINSRQYAAHSLRSGCATTAALLGADILAISRLLGHASTRTTEKYIRYADRFARNVLKGAL